MNITTLEHSVIAVFIMLIFTSLGSLLGYPVVGLSFGAGIGAGFFIGREHDQGEHRWISKFGDGTRASMPWWGGFDLRVWTKADSWFDWIAPTAAVGGVAWLIAYGFGWRV